MMKISKNDKGYIVDWIDCNFVDFFVFCFLAKDITGIVCQKF